MTAPQFAAIDDDAADLLSLVADLEHPSPAYEWDQFQAALHVAADSTWRVLKPGPAPEDVPVRGAHAALVDGEPAWVPDVEES